LGDDFSPSPARVELFLPSPLKHKRKLPPPLIRKENFTDAATLEEKQEMNRKKNGRTVGNNHQSLDKHATLIPSIMMAASMLGRKNKL